jgi:hypothetical protein
VLSCSLWVSVMPWGAPVARLPTPRSSLHPSDVGRKRADRWSSVHFAAKLTDRMDHLRAATNTQSHAVRRRRSGGHMIEQLPRRLGESAVVGRERPAKTPSRSRFRM